MFCCADFYTSVTIFFSVSIYRCGNSHTVFFFRFLIKTSVEFSFVVHFTCLPKTRRVAPEEVEFTLFAAVHLYIPSMSFVVFSNCRNGPSSKYSSTAFGRRSPLLNFQTTVGLGTPLALQVKFVVSPSGTVWLLGDT